MASNNPYCAAEGTGSKVVYQTADPTKTILIQRNIEDYDQTNALDTTCEFSQFLREVVSRYESNERIRVECDQKSSGLLHYIELHDDMNASDGYQAHKKMAEVRRERRVCKNENELLAPLYSYIQQNPKAINELTAVLGRCRAAKEAIDRQIYSARTDII